MMFIKRNEMIKAPRAFQFFFTISIGIYIIGKYFTAAPNPQKIPAEYSFFLMKFR